MSQCEHCLRFRFILTRYQIIKTFYIKICKKCINYMEDESDGSINLFKN